MSRTNASNHAFPTVNCLNNVATTYSKFSSCGFCSLTSIIRKILNNPAPFQPNVPVFSLFENCVISISETFTNPNETIALKRSKTQWMPPHPNSIPKFDTRLQQSISQLSAWLPSLFNRSEAKGDFVITNLIALQKLITLLLCKPDTGLYPNKVTFSLTPNQRLGNQVHNCKIAY